MRDETQPQQMILPGFEEYLIPEVPSPTNSLEKLDDQIVHVSIQLDMVIVVNTLPNSAA